MHEHTEYKVLLNSLLLSSNTKILQFFNNLQLHFFGKVKNCVILGITLT